MKPYDQEKLSFLRMFGLKEKSQISKACDFIEQKHFNQKRYSGEPYVIHPLRIAINLKKDGYDLETIIAGLLHDVVEDTDATDEDLKKTFGDEIAKIVDGVTKVSSIKLKEKSKIFSDKRTFLNQVDNYRKLLFAAIEDLRVMSVKLYDRLDNIETVQYIPEHKRKFYARETIEIFAPIAERLGMGRIKSRLEDQAFQFAFPEIYENFQKEIASRYLNSNQFIQSIIPTVKDHVKGAGIKIVEISGRAKGHYSLHKKLQRKENIDSIYDILALRIIVKNLSDCYKALGIVHSVYEPLPNQIDDYIAKPKDNGYQSIHTTVSDGENIFEVQIRTEEMHQIAEYGFASHWSYKETKNQNSPKGKAALEWFNELKKLSKITDKKDFLANLKDRLFSDQVFVFTPQGEIIRLPYGSTPVDFAYRIHTKLGHRCVGAKINGRIEQLSTKLQNSDLVEIITSKTESPSEDWLKFVKTNEARHKIKGFTKQKLEINLIESGYKKLTNKIEKLGLAQINKLKSEKLLNESRLPYKNLERAAISIAEGNLSVLKLIKVLYPTFDSKELRNIALVKRNEEIVIPSLKNIRHELAQCCKPKISDKVIGYLGREPIIKIHRANCKRIVNADHRRFISI